VDIVDRDPKGYIDEASRMLREKVKLPAGYAISWSGQYEGMQRTKERLKVVIPITLFLIFFLLWLNTRSMTKTFIVLLAVPFFRHRRLLVPLPARLQHEHRGMGGLIALLGVDAETGVFMLLYLDLAYNQARKEGRLRSLEDLQEAIRYGAVRRLRPKFMTVATTFLDSYPFSGPWAQGRM